MKPVADRLLIAGVGLIGASLGLALRERGAVGEIVGLGRSAENLRVARRRGAIDRAERDPARATRGVDLVVVATPVGTIAPLVATLARTLPPTAVLTDAGSVKGPVVAAVERALGRTAARFCGSHPIAGAERAGAASARRDLLQDRRCILTPTARTSATARRRARALWAAAGMRVETMAAARHDDLYALLSHLPQTVATALVNAAAARDNGRALAYAGSGFRDLTRIADSPTVIWRDILLANRAPVLAALAGFGAACERLRRALAAGDGAAVARELGRARRARRRIETPRRAPARRTS
ncbi:MAG: prephenate dehydrogenase/arogenate dehydrogenase family protein [Deltaproteobacteria bacterium]|nr:prephenate dehydrogenase/arogenate dehydrogenase family protein [Deltaproteobacteria bacterium]